MSILSLDGGKNIGFAFFSDSGQIQGAMGVVGYKNFFDAQTSPLQVTDRGMGSGVELWWENTYSIKTIVVEGIRHDPTINQGGSQRWESQVEGAARMLAALVNIPVVVQPPNILPVALMHEEMEWPTTRTGKKKHLPDHLSAWLHGRYYLRSVGLID